MPAVRANYADLALCPGAIVGSSAAGHVPSKHVVAFSVASDGFHDSAYSCTQFGKGLTYIGTSCVRTDVSDTTVLSGDPLAQTQLAGTNT
eukprot:3806718-Prymnesium_polylepis.1